MADIWEALGQSHTATALVNAWGGPAPHPLSSSHFLRSRNAHFGERRMQLVGAGFAGSPSLPASPPHPGISRGAQTRVHPSQNFSTNHLNPAYPCNPCQAQSLPRNTCLVPWLEPGGVPEIGFPLSFKPRLFLLHTYNLQASTPKCWSNRAW